MVRGFIIGYNLFIVSLYCGCLKEEIDKISFALYVRIVTWLKKMFFGFYLLENKFYLLWK